MPLAATIRVLLLLLLLLLRPSLQQASWILHKGEARCVLLSRPHSCEEGWLHAHGIGSQTSRAFRQAALVVHGGPTLTWWHEMEGCTAQ